MEKAPRDLHLAGLGDLLAKFLAFLDWNLARIVTGESYCSWCPMSPSSPRGTPFLPRDRLRSDPARRRGPSPMRRCHRDSPCRRWADHAPRPRPSTRWRISGSRRTRLGTSRWDLHGILTGVASRMMLHTYRAFYDGLHDFTLDEMARLRRYDAEPPWRETVEAGLQPFIMKVNEEMAGRTFGPRGARRPAGVVPQRAGRDSRGG